jgi:hypothetical protein
MNTPPAVGFDQMLNGITVCGSAGVYEMALVILLVIAWTFCFAANSVVTYAPIIVFAWVVSWWLGNVKPRI